MALPRQSREVGCERSRRHGRRGDQCQTGCVGGWRWVRCGQRYAEVLREASRVVAWVEPAERHHGLVWRHTPLQSGGDSKFECGSIHMPLEQKRIFGRQGGVIVAMSWRIGRADCARAPRRLPDRCHPTPRTVHDATVAQASIYRLDSACQMRLNT